MVRKIQSGEYLKRFDNMSSDERASFQDRVGQWLQNGGRSLLEKADGFDARLQNVLKVSVVWNDAECSAFEEGAVLLSAFINSSDTWLPELLYTKASGRCIKRMYEILSEYNKRNEHGAGSVSPVPEKGNTNRPEVDMPGTQSQQQVAIGEQSKTNQHKEQGLASASHAASSSSAPVRPKHIDQYVHLLPKKTQERAGEVRELLRELDAAREKARLLMGSPQASPADMAVWSKKATQIDSKLRNIYDELDREWEKLVTFGKITTDAFGNAVVTADAASTTGEEEEKQKMTSEQKTRRRELRNWLRDRRRGNGNTRETHIIKWKAAYRELVELEPSAAEDTKIIEAARHYGIDLSSLA